MEEDGELDRLLEIHEELRSLSQIWGHNQDWGEDEARGLREEPVIRESPAITTWAGGTVHNPASLGDQVASDPGGPRLGLDHPISRRGFLARGAGTAALVSVGNLLGCQDEHYRALAGGEHRPGVLATREFAVLRAVARRMVPPDGAHPGADELGVAARIDRELGFHPPLIGEDFGLALRLVEWWPLPLRFARFTRLSAAEQDAQLSGMAGSDFALPRSAFQGIKFLVMLFHYSQEAAWPAIGYGGPFVERGPASTQSASPAP